MARPHRRRRFFALGEGGAYVEVVGGTGPIVDQPLHHAPATPRLSGADFIPPAKVEFVAPNPLQEPVAVDQPPKGSPRAGSGPSPRGRFLADGRNASIRLALLVILCVSLGLLGEYLLSESGTKAVDSPSDHKFQTDKNPLTPNDLAILDVAYTALRTGKYPEAERLFTDFGRKHQDRGAMEVEAGRAMLYENKPDGAIRLLRAAADHGAMPAETNFLLGVIYNAERSFPQAESFYAKAVTFAPAEASYFYAWGECLRAQGKLFEASRKFRMALLRNQYETATGLYRAMLWLNEIEADQDELDGTEAEINSDLAQPLPTMEAFFAAAARSLKTGDINAATEQLLHAQQRADPAVFVIVLQDPIFDQVRARLKLALVSPSPSSPQSQQQAGQMPNPAASGAIGQVRPIPTASASGTPAPSPSL